MNGTTSLPTRVLVVDDDPESLHWLGQALRLAGYANVEPVQDPREVLAACRRNRPDLILLDLDMPHWDGCRVLDEMLELRDALPPPVVVIVDPGQNDLLAQALERGAQDFVTRPFERNQVLLRVRNVLYAETSQRKLREAQQAQKTLKAEMDNRVRASIEEAKRGNEQIRQGFLTSIRTMANLIEMRGGIPGGRGRELAIMAREIGQALGADASLLQDVSLAGLLCRIGEITLPDAIIFKHPSQYTAAERALFQRHPVAGAQALMAISELQQPAKLIRHQLERFDGTGVPDGLKGDDIPLGSRILAVARACFEASVSQSGSTGAPLTQLPPAVLAGRGSQFDPQVVDALKVALAQKARDAAAGRDDLSQTLHGGPVRMTGRPVVTLTIDKLRAGMGLMRSLYTKNGLLLLASGQQLTDDMIDRLREFERSEGQRLEVAVAVTPPAS